MSVQTNWKIIDTKPDNEIIQCCGGNKVLASLLLNRGINTPEKINKFLNPLKVKLLDPDVFTDMQKAYERIKSAIENNQHITVYGDFDTDGITSTSLLYLTLKEIGADVDYYIPDRSTESHGLNSTALVPLISKKHTKLIITVDCGISNASQVAFAKIYKCDVIITDHHEAPEVLPDAYAIINPKAQGAIDSDLSVDDIDSLNYLAGVGVAFKLACKLLKEYGKENFVNNILPLVAVGTIGDVVELLGENRTLVTMGLELIRNNAHKGITQLLKDAGLEDLSKIQSENVAFSVVPRLNASGRLEFSDSDKNAENNEEFKNTDYAIRVLISENDDEIKQASKILNDLNTQRQDLCDETFKSADEMYKKDILHNKKSIVLLNENWNGGVIGIVCSKLIEKYNKPTFLMTRDADSPNIIKGSCRSIAGVNIHAILSAHKDLFEKFGGHKMAAGFSFDENKVSFEKFKNLLNETIDEHTQGIDFGKINLYADMELSPDDITVDLVNLIDKMQPFGSANRSPLFVMNDTVLTDFKMMGQKNNHLKMFINKDNSKLFECVKWNFPDFPIPKGAKLDLLFSLKLNIFNNTTSVQLMAEDIHSPFLNKKQLSSQVRMIDNRKKTNIINQVIDFLYTTKFKTGIFIENSALIKQLKIPEDLNEKIFTHKDIPSDIEQLMFFDAPSTSEEFINIYKSSGAKIVHLMNFNNIELDTDVLISKISGMLKYSISNMNGEFSLERISSALNVSEEITECALMLLEDMQVTDLNKISEQTYKISYIHPVELSKLKTSDLYSELDEQIKKMNTFKSFYKNSSIDEIKEIILC